MSISKVGWIGLGKMGIPMSTQLIKAGFAVTVYNRSKEKEDALKALGAIPADSPSDVIKASDLVILMVTNDQAAREIFTGKNGLLGAATTGRIIINMSTVSPEVSRELAALCQQQGQHYLDAPVSGSVKQAQEGQLVIMVGGEEAALQNARPVLEHLGRLVLPVGGTGAGNTAKLAINLLLGVFAQGLSEAVVFARENGIKTEDFIAIVNNSALGNVFAKIKGDAILNDNYQAAFALKHIAKDLRLAKDLGLRTPLAQVTFQSFQQAEPALGEEDIIAILKQVEHHG